MTLFRSVCRPERKSFLLSPLCEQHFYVAGRFDLDPEAKVRTVELRQEMKSAAEEISRNAGLMNEARHTGMAGQVKSLACESERGLSKGKDFEMER